MARPKKTQNTDSNLMTAPAPETEKPNVDPVSQNPVPSIDSPHIPGPSTNFLQVVGQIPDTNTNKGVDWSKLPNDADTSVTTNNRPLRDNRGLLHNVEYVFTPEGLIDWKAMLFKKPEYLYVLNDNKEEVEKRYGKSIKELNPLEIEEKYLCITLQGIRYLANLRGYTRIKNKVDSVTYDPDYQVAVACTSTCEITWLPNFETEYRLVKTSDTAGANLRNCFGFSQKYIESIAANRAFVRAVRAYLGISIVAKDEVGPQEKNPFEPLIPIKNPNRDEDLTQAVHHNPYSLLEKNVNKLGITFEQFKSAVQKKYKDKIKSDPEIWQDYSSIPRSDIFELIPIIQEKIQERTTK